MNYIISGDYKGYGLALGYGKIWVHNDSDEIQINQETIQSYEVLDSTSSTTTNNVTNTDTKTKGRTRKSTVSMGTRALVGGALLGPAGAIVGAATAKNKTKSTSKSTSYGTTSETTTRELKVLVTLKNAKKVLLELDDDGYATLLEAAYSTPYESYQEMYQAQEAEVKARREVNKKQSKGFWLYFSLPAIWLYLLFHNNSAAFWLMIGFIAYKIARKRLKEKQTKKLNLEKK